MYPQEVVFDAKDTFLHSQVGRWIVLKWRGDLFLPPREQAYGTHLATFLLCRFGEEIRGLNYRWLYTDSQGRTSGVGKPLEGINSTWFFKYETLKKFDATTLSLNDAELLELPDFDTQLHADLAPIVRELRNDPRLSPFRHPGFPDDVFVACGQGHRLPESTIQVLPELVWVRLNEKVSDSQFIGILLNQPTAKENRKGDSIAVELVQAEIGNVLVCKPQ